MDKKTGFLMAAFSLAMLSTLEADETEKSARWNKCRNAQDAVLKVCDIYLPGGINTIDLNAVWEVLDGPVTQVLQDNAEKILGVDLNT